MKTSWYSVKTVGRYQWHYLLPYVTAVVFSGWANVGILVIAPKISFRCADSSPNFQKLSVSEQMKLMPAEQCYKPVIGSESVEELKKKNRSNFELAKCEEFVYDKAYFDFTATEQFDLVCDKQWVIPMASTIYMMGFFCAAVTSGTISDRFGRRPTTIGSCLLGFVANLSAAFAPTLELFLVARFFAAVSDIATYTCGLVLITELVRKDQRIIPKVLNSLIGGCIGSVTVGLTAIVFRDSRVHQTITAVMLLLCAVRLWFIAVESPRWLAAENRQKEAHEVVKYIADFNGLEESDLAHLERPHDNSGGAASILDLFRTPLIRKRTLILIFMWFSLVFVYYALTFNLDTFYPDVRISLMISGALDFPSVIIAIITIDLMGRSFTSFLYMLLAGIFCLLMIPLVEAKGSVGLLTLALLGKTMASNQFFIIYVYTQELFPTVCRNMGLGFCSSVARIAGMLAPQIVLLNNYWPPATVVILGTFGIASGLMAPLLPDTTGIELAQTLSEGENFVKDHKYSLRWPASDLVQMGDEVKSAMSGNSSPPDQETKPILGDQSKKL